MTARKPPRKLYVVFNSDGGVWAAFKEAEHIRLYKAPIWSVRTYARIDPPKRAKGKER